MRLLWLLKTFQWGFPTLRVVLQAGERVVVVEVVVDGLGPRGLCVDSGCTYDQKQALSVHPNAYLRFFS